MASMWAAFMPSAFTVLVLLGKPAKCAERLRRSWTRGSLLFGKMAAASSFPRPLL